MDEFWLGIVGLSWLTLIGLAPFLPSTQLTETSRAPSCEAWLTKKWYSLFLSNSLVWSIQRKVIEDLKAKPHLHLRREHWSLFLAMVDIMDPYTLGFRISKIRITHCETDGASHMSKSRVTVCKYKLSRVAYAIFSFSYGNSKRKHGHNLTYLC